MEKKSKVVIVSYVLEQVVFSWAIVTVELNMVVVICVIVQEADFIVTGSI